jgi:serine/threonine protein kinase
MKEGPVGELCSSEVCASKGYRFIPKPWFEAAKEFAKKKGRPIDPLLGRKLDRYLLAGKLGEGGMGAVYMAYQQPLFREVALKLISGLELNEQTVARFEREARAISALDHPNIVKLYDYGIGRLEETQVSQSDIQLPFMALEYVKQGRSLRKALNEVRKKEGGRIPQEVVINVFDQMLNALGAAHDMGIVHRDMKPENVMITAVRGNPMFVKVLDFGLAKAVHDVTGFDGNVSKTGQFLGTPYYMAPEQAPRKGKPQVDGRADLYAVAVMLFEVFTGVLPFDGETALEVLTKKVDPSYDPMELPQAKELPQALREFLAKGLKAEPEQRFANAQEMAQTLKAALATRRITAAGLRMADISSSTDRPVPPSGVDSASGQRLEQAAGAGTSQAKSVSQAPSAPQSVITQQGAEDELRLSKMQEARGKKGIFVALGLLVALGVGGGVYFGVLKGSEGGEESVAKQTTSAETLEQKPQATVTIPVEEKKAHETKAGQEVAGVASQEKKLKKISITIKTEPPQAVVLVDGHELGKSPAKYEFEADEKELQNKKARVVARLEGFEELSKELSGSDLTQDEVVLVLKKKPRTQPKIVQPKARERRGGFQLK